MSVNRQEQAIRDRTEVAGFEQDFTRDGCTRCQRNRPCDEHRCNALTLRGTRCPYYSQSERGWQYCHSHGCGWLLQCGRGDRPAIYCMNQRLRGCYMMTCEEHREASERDIGTPAERKALFEREYERRQE